MAAWPPRFLFVSGRISLDLAHTGRADVPRWERLVEPDDLRDWLATGSLGLTLGRVRPAELRAAHDLRTRLWEALGAVLAGRPLAPETRAAINALAARPDLVAQLAGTERRWRGGATATQALATIARDAVALFGSDQRQRIRECQNPRCSIVFVDLSRPGRRAWCSMKRCGNLQKTARYRKSKR